MLLPQMLGQLIWSTESLALVLRTTCDWANVSAGSGEVLAFFVADTVVVVGEAFGAVVALGTGRGRLLSGERSRWR